MRWISRPRRPGPPRASEFSKTDRNAETPRRANPRRNAPSGRCPRGGEETERRLTSGTDDVPPPEKGRLNFRRQPALRPVDLAQARRVPGSSAGTGGVFPHGFDLTRFAPDRLHSACDGRGATRPPGPPVLAQGCVPLDRSPPPLQAWYQEAPPHATGTGGPYHGAEGWVVEGVCLTSESVVSAGGARGWRAQGWIPGPFGAPKSGLS